MLFKLYLVFYWGFVRFVESANPFECLRLEKDLNDEGGDIPGRDKFRVELFCIHPLPAQCHSNLVQEPDFFYVSFLSVLSGQDWKTVFERGQKTAVVINFYSSPSEGFVILATLAVLAAVALNEICSSPYF